MRSYVQNRKAEGQADPSFVALDGLYDQFALSVERWLRRLGVPPNEIEDTLHDVFVVALRQYGSFRGDCRVDTWLFAIATKLVRRRRVKERLRRALAAIWLRPQEPVSETASELFANGESARRLQAALDRVPEIYRLPIILFELEGYSGEDAAALLGCSVSTLWVRLHRGRQKLKELLMRAGDES
ncbi:MAG: RNA polymerase sigma factor [Myxococcales bacterium]|nr:RNA polymerase sigma factor [Myxococcales bacterium]